MPDPCGLFVLESIFAVAHVAEGQALHERPRLEQARLWVLHGPEAGPQVADDLERAKHQPVARRQIPRPSAQGARVLRANWAGPHHVEAAQRALVQLHHVAAQGGPKFGVQVYADDLPAFSLEPVPLKSSRSLGVRAFFRGAGRQAR